MESDESMEMTQELKRLIQQSQGVLTDSRYCAKMEHHTVCPVCEGKGKIMVEGWKLPRPCKWCQGVGQLNKGHIPHPMEVQEWVNNQ
jgi:DnaJ-class molecular chaperone